jgi:hypothetical protein
MVELPAFNQDEALGRAVWDSKKARTAAVSGNIHWRIFREKDGVKDLSVDRISHGGLAGLATLHDTEREGQKFHGWASISFSNAAKMDRVVKPDPIEPINPYHALIVLPEAEAVEFIEAQYQHALNLAMSASWLPRSMGY